MHWLNNIDIEQYTREFNAQKRIMIMDALPESVAQSLYDSIDDINEGNLWYQSQRGNLFYNNMYDGVPLQDDFVYKFDKYPLCGMSLESLIGLKGDSRRIDFEDILRFSDHPEEELPKRHPLRIFADFLNSKNAIEPINKITGHEIYENSALTFLSRYMRGDFLTQHDDTGPKGKRLITFVLNLSKNWKHHFGGQTLFFKNENNSFADSYTPFYNSLILFEVPMIHCVLPVSAYANVPRYAISGWFLKP